MNKKEICFMSRSRVCSIEGVFKMGKSILFQLRDSLEKSSSKGFTASDFMVIKGELEVFCDVLNRRGRIRL